MHRGLILFLIALGVFAGMVRGQSYSGTVLYELAGPTGFGLGTPPPVPDEGVDFGGQTIANANNNVTHISDPMVWSATGVATNLVPSLPGITDSFVEATDATQQVGYGGPTTSNTNDHALVWNGTAASAVDLNPAGMVNSAAYEIAGGQQVGFASTSATGANPHAYVWTGTAASGVDLNPTTNLSANPTSEALGTNGIQQFGEWNNTTTGTSSTGQPMDHAAMWMGTAASMLDLNPVGASAINGSILSQSTSTQQTGIGYSGLTGTSDIAYVWEGTAASAVSLNPTTLNATTTSFAMATNGTVEIGCARGTGTSNAYHALAWFGTADSAIDLNSSISALGFTTSFASSFDSSGNIYGIAHGTYNGVTASYAIEWQQTSAAAPESWGSPASNNWSTGSSWSTQIVPNSVTGVTFNTGSASPYTASLSVSSTANSINVADNVTIQKNGFNLTVPGAVTINGTSGQHASLALSGAGANTFGSLSINSFGQLDVTDNAVVIDYGVGNPSPVGSIAASISSGYSGGTWNGAGIVSSKVASVNAAHGNPHFFGVAFADASDPAVSADGFTPGTVVIEPALVGDANLDGKVNFSDFLLLSANFNKPGTTWDQGNFNYGATTNFGDFLLLSANFNQSTSLDNAELNAMNQFAHGFGDSLVANADGDGFAVVPEPAYGPMLFIASAAILMRPKRREIINSN